MNWVCKICKFETPRKKDLLKHFRLRHNHESCLPCLHWECYCSFKTWGGLKTHLSRFHSTNKIEPNVSFLCPCCSIKSFSSEREYFHHIGRHLKKHETVCCVFENCHFKTNIIGTFASHRTRKHNPHSLEDFKPGLVQR